jgi:hypothetical protein
MATTKYCAPSQTPFIITPLDLGPVTLLFSLLEKQTDKSASGADLCLPGNRTKRRRSTNDKRMVSKDDLLLSFHFAERLCGSGGRAST